MHISEIEQHIHCAQNTSIVNKFYFEAYNSPKILFEIFSTLANLGTMLSKYRKLKLERT